MSDHRAIADLTEALRVSLQRVADTVVPDSRVEIGPPIPTEPGGRPVVRLFLYSVMPRPTIGNYGEAVRGGDGSPARTPALMLELHYLVTFIGDDPGLATQVLLGAVMASMNARPWVSMADGNAAAPDGESDGRALIEIEPLAGGDLARLWNLFPGTPYALSIAYRCTMTLPGPVVGPPPATPAIG